MANRVATKKSTKKPKISDFPNLLGIALTLFGAFLIISFISYFFTWQEDFNLVDDPSKGLNKIQKTRNIMGWIGAYVAHIFVYKFLGATTILLAFLIFFIGVRLVIQRDFISFELFTQKSVFIILWTSVFMGFFVYAFDQNHTHSYIQLLSGQIGYSINEFLYPYLKITIPFLLLFALYWFFLYFYNINFINHLRHFSSGVIHNFSLLKDSFSFLKNPYNSSKKPPFYPDESRSQTPESSKKDNTINDTDESTELDFVIKNNTPPPVSKPNKNIDLEVEFEEDLPEVIPKFPEKTNFLEDLADNLIEKIGKYDSRLELPKYQFPTVELLKEYVIQKSQVSKEELEANKEKIIETLNNYGIGITKIKATIGPTVTLYQIVPDAGVRISKIKNLQDDIALSLAALGIRIIAPMPGEGTIGIEVPNKNPETVPIKVLLQDKKFLETTFDLPIVLGKTIANEIFIADLAKMPHLLIAGATGQGKSVGLNVLLASLIYKKHPSELKFVLIDPKKVELSLFTKLENHFLAKLPQNEEAIITDTKKVVQTLQSLCIEMDNRYNLLKEAGCKNLNEYNQKFMGRRLNPEKGHRFLPYIVLVIDELADLMMTAGKEVEQPIARLAQLARAIGIHLVVATQRPSVNVITGIIKTNFPARLSFKVTSKIDSRTILDEGGADQLVGRGDMLLKQNSDMIRLQCAFIDTKEIEDICDFIGEQRGFDSAYLLPEYVGDDTLSEKDDSGGSQELDPLFEDAARLIVLHQQGSTSLIQRRMNLGYNRSGRIIDQMERVGIVGPFTGSKARQVFVRDEQELEILLQGLRR